MAIPIGESAPYRAYRTSIRNWTFYLLLPLCLGNHGSVTTGTGDFYLSFSFGHSVVPTTFPADEVAIRLSVCMHLFPESKPCSRLLCEVEELVVFKPSFRGVFGTCSERYQNHECKRYHHEQLEAWNKRQPDNNKADDV
jgi:hypothetical protein